MLNLMYLNSIPISNYILSTLTSTANILNIIIIFYYICHSWLEVFDSFLWKYLEFITFFCMFIFELIHFLDVTLPSFILAQLVSATFEKKYSELYSKMSTYCNCTIIYHQAAYFNQLRRFLLDEGSFVLLQNPIF